MDLLGHSDEIPVGRKPRRLAARCSNFTAASFGSLLPVREREGARRQEAASLLHEPGQDPDAVPQQLRVRRLVHQRLDHGAIHTGDLARFDLALCGLADQDAMDRTRNRSPGLDSAGRRRPPVERVVEV